MSRWIDAEKELKKLKDMKVEGEVFTTAVDFAIKVIEEAPSIDLVHCGECELKRLCDNAGGVDDWNYCYWGRRMKGTDDEKR